MFPTTMITFIVAVVPLVSGYPTAMATHYDSADSRQTMPVLEAIETVVRLGLQLQAKAKEDDAVKNPWTIFFSTLTYSKAR